MFQESWLEWQKEQLLCFDLQILMDFGLGLNMGRGFWDEEEKDEFLILWSKNKCVKGVYRYLGKFILYNKST